MTKPPEGKRTLLCVAPALTGLGMAFHMELDKAAWGWIPFLTCSQVTRHIAFPSPPSDNETPFWALPECCLGNLLPLGTSSGTASVQAPAWCHLVDKNTPCATSSPGAHVPPGWCPCSQRQAGRGREQAFPHLATQAFKPVQVLCSEGVQLASFCWVLEALVSVFVLSFCC